MVKRFLAIALTVVLAITTVWAVVPLSAFADEMPVYRASEEYEADLHYNPTAHWEWDYYDAAAERYEKLPYLRNQTSGSRGFSISGSYDACTAVGQYNLYGDTRKNNEGGFIKDDTYEYSWQRYNPTRTFTVPQSGNITITADDGQGGTRITTDGTAAPNLRIRLERSGDYTQVWPTDNEWQSVSADEPVNFGTLILNIKKGDKLHFELSAQHANTSSCWRMRAYWDPVVKYNSFVSIADFQPSAVEQLPLNQVFTITTEGEMESVSASDVSIAGTTNAAVRDFSFTEGNTISFAFDGLVYNGTYEVEVGGLKPVGSSGEGEVYRFTFTTFTLKQYQASDYYDASGKSNPYTMGKEAPWSWESYDLKTKTYTLLPSFNSSRGYAIVDNYNAVTAVSDSAMYGDTRQSGQGGFTADETYTYAWQRYYPVRTFTVPESGKVTVSEADGTITAPSSAAPGLRILLERNGEFTQLWPETGWKSVNVSAPVCFAPMVQNVIEGDKLHFELSAVDASASSCWTMYANWNPVVAYNEKHPTVTEIFPENGAVNVPGNTEFVVNFSQEICEPSVQDAEIDGDAAVADIWLENGNEVHILLDSTTLKEKTSYTLRLKNIRLKNFDEQNSFEQRIIFTTADYTVFGEFSRSGASVILPINNTLGETRPVSVTMIVVLCQGTPERYTVKSAQHQTEVITGKQDMSITLDTVPGSGEFVKAAAVTAPAFGKLLTDMAILE